MGVDIYDARVNQFLQHLEVPERVFAAPSNCLEDLDACIASPAGEFAGDVSVVVAEQLSRHLGLSPHGQPPAVRGVTPYSVTLRSFETRGSPCHHRGYGR